MRSIEPGGTGHNGTDPASSDPSSRSEIALGWGVEAAPLDHHLEEVMEALSELSAAEADPGRQAYTQ